MLPLKPIRWILLTAACVALSGGAGFASDDVALDFKETDHVFDVHGSFHVEAQASAAWDVLTGYERIPRFVDGLKKSHVQEDLGPYHFLLEQEFEGGFLFITMRVHVLLDVHEVWYKSIQFTDIDHSYFELYKGTWELSPDPDGGLWVHYNLKAKQKSEDLFAGDFMKGGIRDLLDAVRREILHHQEQIQKERTASVRATPSTGIERAPERAEDEADRTAN
jgi:hypothetical protein